MCHQNMNRWETVNVSSPFSKRFLHTTHCTEVPEGASFRKASINAERCASSTSKHMYCKQTESNNIRKMASSQKTKKHPAFKVSEHPPKNPPLRSWRRAHERCSRSVILWEASQASQRLSTMTPDGCVLWEARRTSGERLREAAAPQKLGGVWSLLGPKRELISASIQFYCRMVRCCHHKLIEWKFSRFRWPSGGRCGASLYTFKSRNRRPCGRTDFRRKGGGGPRIDLPGARTPS